MTRDYSLFVKDILEAINYIETFVGNTSYEEFLIDERTKSAVVWKIHVIGEAAKNIPKAVRDDHKDLPWKYMTKIRDKIAHFYFGIDYEIVWQVATKKLPEIKPTIEKMLKALQAQGKTANEADN